MPNRNEHARARRWVCLASSATLVALAAVAAASAAGRGPTRAVTFARTSLISPRGVEVLYERIVRAAKAVCPPYLYGDLTATAERHIVRKCRENAVESAVHQVHDPHLSAMEALRKGRG